MLKIPTFNHVLIAVREAERRRRRRRKTATRKIVGTRKIRKTRKTRTSPTAVKRTRRRTRKTRTSPTAVKRTRRRTRRKVVAADRLRVAAAARAALLPAVTAPGGYARTITVSTTRTCAIGKPASVESTAMPVS